MTTQFIKTTVLALFLTILIGCSSTNIESAKIKSPENFKNSKK